MGFVRTTTKKKFGSWRQETQDAYFNSHHFDVRCGRRWARRTTRTHCGTVSSRPTIVGYLIERKISVCTACTPQSGAIAQKIGRFEMADKGTLFLDEVGDIPAALQPKLLRFLQEQEFERLGSGRTHKVNVRLVAATNRNLAEMVGRNEFRCDFRVMTYVSESWNPVSKSSPELLEGWRHARTARSLPRSHL
jgi:sigma-54 interacting transcriptional regulator